MRIAVASAGLEVSEYFESCTNYNYFTITNGELTDYRNLPILDRKSTSAIDILTELDVDILIVGCLKKSNRIKFEEYGISVLCGAKGNAKQTVEDYMTETFIACDGSCDEPTDETYEAIDIELLDVS